MKEVRTLYVDKGEEGVRLDRWFKRRWPHLNHIQIQKLAPTLLVFNKEFLAAEERANRKVPSMPSVLLPPESDLDEAEPRVFVHRRSRR